MPVTAGPTLREMCELIAEWMNANGLVTRVVTWQDIWEYSPTGELSMIWVWYEAASAWNAARV